MSKTKGLDLKNILPQLRKYQKLAAKHAVFTAVVIVLLSYIFVVFRIDTLANAEPSPDQSTTTTQKIPVVDKAAIKQIQSLEQNNTGVHSLFESARDNPFQE